MRFVLVLLTLCGLLRADTLTFRNGDQLIGTLVRADAKGCIFRSDMAGTVTVAWSKIQQLETLDDYIVVASDGRVQKGQLRLDGNIIEITGSLAAQPAFVAPGDTRMIVDPKTYINEVTARPPLWRSWRGLVSGGFNQVSATQSSSSFTAAVDLQRPVPMLAWLPQRSNTLVHFRGTYGQLSQPNQPTVRTSILNAGVEQDRNVTARLFLFADTQLDHNIAQGLEFQQAYGGGAGWKLFASQATQLSLRADLHWTHQRFLAPSSESFVASSFTESLRQTYGRLVWTENVSLTPSYTNGAAYQMSGLSSWAVPLYRSLSLNFNVVDSYLHNPQRGFLRNSLQYSTGIQITIR
ncbi:MAG TPA: DUF481 domain-containing protein [Terriglobales bacterium]